MLVKAFFLNKGKPWLIVPCLFNPESLSVTKSNEFASINIPGLSSPTLQFVRGEGRSVTLDLFFDTYEEKIDVRIFTDRITGWDSGSMFSNIPDAVKGLMDIDSDLHAPPVCLFVWGTFIFQCIVQQVTKKFTMFLPIGIPVRATLNVTLKECRELKAQVKEMNLSSADLSKEWVVKKGDSLWSIAAREYGDSASWRLIADANHISNPRLLEPGRGLIIPVK